MRGDILEDAFDKLDDSLHVVGSERLVELYHHWLGEGRLVVAQVGNHVRKHGFSDLGIGVVQGRLPVELG